MNPANYGIFISDVGVGTIVQDVIFVFTPKPVDVLNQNSKVIFNNIAVDNPNTQQCQSSFVAITNYNQPDTNIQNGWTLTFNTGVFVCPATGTYQISYTAQVNSGNSAPGTVSFIAYNLTQAVEVKYSQEAITIATASTNMPISTTFLATLNAGDNIVFQFVGPTTSGWNISSNGAGSKKPCFKVAIVKVG